MTFALLKTLKLISYLLILTGLYAFWRRKIRRIRTIVLTLLWMSLAMVFAFFTKENSREDEFDLIFSSLLFTAPLFTIYWISKGIKDWLDPNKYSKKL